MFHSVLLKKIDFCSNPPLDPIPHVVRDISDNGSPINSFKMITRDNKSSFAGSHYDPEKHSLRAMLNLGIELTPVGYDITDNDVNSLSRKARNLSSQIEASVSSRNVQNVTQYEKEENLS